MPVLVHVSAVDRVDGAWDEQDSVRLSRALADIGADLIDASSGGLVPDAKIALGPGCQVPFADVVRKKAEVPAGAVGLITDARQAETIPADGSTGIVLLARELLRDPYWPLHTAVQLGAEVRTPKPYARAFWKVPRLQGLSCHRQPNP